MPRESAVFTYYAVLGCCSYERNYQGTKRLGDWATPCPGAKIAETRVLYSHRRFNMRMRLVVYQFKIVVMKPENIFYLWVKVHLRQWERGSA